MLWEITDFGVVDIGRDKILLEADIKGYNCLLPADIRAIFKCYQTLSEKANHGRIGASAASVEARDWLFQIGPGVASA